MFDNVHINHESALPLYAQIKAHLLHLITAEVLKPGTRLPSEGELCRIYGVSRLTVRQALAELVAEGLLQRQQGVGTFVTQPKMNITYEVPLSFTQRMHLAGRTPASRVLALEKQTAPAEVATYLHLASQAQVIFLARVRLADGEPVMVEKSWLPYDRFPEVLRQDFRYQSLYHFLAVRYNVTVAESYQSLEVTSLDRHAARELGVEADSPAMLVKVVAYDEDRRPVETSQALVRGDVARYVFHLHRVNSWTSARRSPPEPPVAVPPTSLSYPQMSFPR